jgi:guanine deaminase
MNAQIIRGPVLNPRPDGTVEFWEDGALAADTQGRLTFAGSWAEFAAQGGGDETRITPSDGGLILPPLLDCHTHIPQHPIRGRFTEGIEESPPEGRLLAGLQRNVFPLEARAADTEYASRVVAAFHQDTLAQGVVGGAAYMTVHAGATRAALATLSDFWSVGLVLMNQNCPRTLRTDEDVLERDIHILTADFGRRFIVTDRFAVAVDTPLRRRASDLARRLGLRMQTHLNEQRAEKALVEETLYPGYANYTDVYRQDGLLARDAILAHCIQMTPEEWDMIADAGAPIAHCPTSNTLLGSGTMPLDTVRKRELAYAICTDVGASPTTSLLAEMAQFLTVHAGRSRFSTPQEALWRVTLGPAQILGLDAQLGSFDIGKPLSCVIADCDLPTLSGKTADAVIADGLLAMPSGPLRAPALDRLAAEGLSFGDDLAQLTADVHATASRLEGRIRRVVLDGKTVWQRREPPQALTSPDTSNTRKD